MNIEITGIDGDIYRSVKTLLETPAGTLVNDREYGIDWSGVDHPPEVAETMLMAEVEEKIERYEPRATVENIISEAAANGTLTIRVVLAYAN